MLVEISFDQDWIRLRQIRLIKLKIRSGQIQQDLGLNLDWPRLVSTKTELNWVKSDKSRLSLDSSKLDLT